MTSQPSDDTTAGDAGSEPATDGAEASVSPEAGSTEDDETGDEPLFSPAIRRFPWLRAAGTGVAAFAVEFVVVALLFLVGPLSTQASSLMTKLTSYAFVLYNAHHVPITVSSRGVTYTGPTQFNLVTGAETELLPVYVYLAIPVLGLLAAGALVEWYRDDAGEGLLEGSVIVGVGVMAGYVVVAMIGTVVFVSQTNFDPGVVTQGPLKTHAVILMAAYPLVVGAIGALLVRGPTSRYAETWRSYSP